MLYLSKIENQSILANKNTFNLSEQIRLVVSLLDKEISDKEIKISLTGEEYSVTGNEEMLKQVWINILDNAVKFTPDNGNVEISITSDEDILTVRIFNEGTPMASDVQQHLFDRFYQGDSSHSTSGNGLGLAIAKKIVSLHGGDVNAAPEKNGNTFEVRLPATGANISSY